MSAITERARAVLRPATASWPWETWAWPRAAWILAVAAPMLLVAFNHCTSTPANPPEPQIPPLARARTAEVIKEYRAFPKVKLPAQPIAMAHGPKSALVTIEDFGDFRCPHCYDALQTLKRAEARHPGKIRIVFRNFPLDGSCNSMVGRKQRDAQSCRAAFAAICAQEQNLFSPMQDRLFRLQLKYTPISEAVVQGITKDIGGDWAKLGQCLNSQRAKRSLAVDLQAAQAVNIEATPTLVVQGHLLPAGAPEPEALFHLLDALVYESESQQALLGP